MKYTIVGYCANYYSVEVESDSVEEVEALFDKGASALFENADAVNQGPWELDSITSENGETIFY